MIFDLILNKTAGIKFNAQVPAANPPGETTGLRCQGPNRGS